jgi:uncharacterized protein (DUF305 family)
MFPALPALAEKIDVVTAEKNDLEKKRDQLEGIVEDQKSKMKKMEDENRALSLQVNQKEEEIRNLFEKATETLISHLQSDADHREAWLDLTSAWNLYNEANKGIIRDLSQILVAVNWEAGLKLVTFVIQRHSTAVAMAKQRLEEARQVEKELPKFTVD